MSLTSNLTAAFTSVATQIKQIRVLISGTSTGDVSSLATSSTNLVGAINEVRAAMVASAVSINDTTASTSSVYSSTKTDSQISVAVAALVNSSPAALDTLNELAAAIGNDPNFAATLTTSIGTKANAADVFTRTALGTDADVHSFVTDFTNALTT